MTVDELLGALSQYDLGAPVEVVVPALPAVVTLVGPPDAVPVVDVYAEARLGAPGRYAAILVATEGPPCPGHRSR